MGHVSAQVYEMLGAWIGLGPVRDNFDLAQIAERGLSVQKFEHLKTKSKMLDSELHPLVLPRRTLAHRKAKRQSLTKDESDRALRVAYIVALAETIFGDSQRAMHWLRKPMRAFNGRTPIDLIGTETGARTVEERLYAIDEGIYV